MEDSKKDNIIKAIQKILSENENVEIITMDDQITQEAELKRKKRSEELNALLDTVAASLQERFKESHIEELTVEDIVNWER